MPPQSRHVLVTGATGFIGRRLVRSLLADGYRVRCLVRQPDASLPDGAEKVTGDILQPLSLPKAFRGIDTVYYLVHSLATAGPGFERRDRQAAEYFREAADAAQVKRVIYLGGLGESTAPLSHHLASRLEVGRILKEGCALTTLLRAAVIIGAGGASFELIRSLVERLPLIIAPRWISTRCQPIAVQDVISYLTGCLADERTAGETFDIGGPEVLTYRQMLEELAAIEGGSARIVSTPFLPQRLSSYLAALLTPGIAPISIALIEGLKNEVICREQRIRQILPIPLLTYAEAVRLALAEEGRK